MSKIFCCASAFTARGHLSGRLMRRKGFLVGMKSANHVTIMVPGNDILGKAVSKARAFRPYQRQILLFWTGDIITSSISNILLHNSLNRN